MIFDACAYTIEYDIDYSLKRIMIFCTHIYQGEMVEKLHVEIIIIDAQSRLATTIAQRIYS
jgi:hypothetical protein